MTNDDPRCSKPGDCKRKRNRVLCRTCWRRTISRAANSVVRRQAIAQPDHPYVRQYLATGLFSAPIKTVSADDRALIDRFLAERRPC